MDSATNATGIQATADLGFRKLSVCAACNKDSKYLKKVVELIKHQLYYKSWHAKVHER